MILNTSGDGDGYYDVKDKVVDLIARARTNFSRLRGEARPLFRPLAKNSHLRHNEIFLPIESMKMTQPFQEKPTHL